MGPGGVLRQVAVYSIFGHHGTLCAAHPRRGRVLPFVLEAQFDSALQAGAEARRQAAGESIEWGNQRGVEKEVIISVRWMPARRRPLSRCSACHRPGVWTRASACDNPRLGAV